MGDLTAANSVLTLSVPPLFPIPQQLQGFAANDVYNVPAIQSVEVLMGVDGVLSGGFVYKQIEQDITLQADSDSVFLFDQWWTQMVASQAVYSANGIIKLPSISTKFVMTNGFLTSYTPAPRATQLLQPRHYRVTWNLIQPQPD
jgi:hypothetical protein